MKIRLLSFLAAGLTASLIPSCGAANSANGYATRIMQSVQRTIGTAQ